MVYFAATRSPLAGYWTVHSAGQAAQLLALQVAVQSLEQQFNQMARQPVDSFGQRQALSEQIARREEPARIEQEMSSANYIQQSLLPEQVPSIPGWPIRALYRSAREVGGELYDF